jgi:hypothetical protein
MKLKERLEQLERKVKELEARPLIQYHYHYGSPHPWYAPQPWYVPPPQPYCQPAYTITTTPNTAFSCITTSTSHEACGGLITITQ